MYLVAPCHVLMERSDLAAPPLRPRLQEVEAARIVTVHLKLMFFLLVESTFENRKKYRVDQALTVIR